jgi:UDP-N-acetyl-D-glucosamine dehydrogenase
MPKVQWLTQGQSYILHLISSPIAELAASKRFRESSTFVDLGACDVLVICLQTPFRLHNERDVSYVMSTVYAIAGFLATQRRPDNC